MNLDVVIVTHNSDAELPVALGQLPAEARVFVVDNASTDATVARATRPGVHVASNPVNAGFGAGANQGAALGLAEMILFLNPDASIAATDLEHLVATLRDDPTLAIVSPRIRYPDGSEQRVRWPYPSTVGAWREAFGLHRLTRRATSDGFVIGACFLVRRSVFEQLGGFDIRYWLYGEETDLCRRAMDAGWRVAVDGDAWAEHVGGASVGSESALVAEHFARGAERFVADREGARGLVSFRVANLVGSAVRLTRMGPDERRVVHRARFRREVRVLASHPATVPLDSPATSAPGRALVVCSLEAWDDVWRRNQFLVRELLRADPHLRVLYVEPSFDRLQRLRRPGGAPRRRGFRNVGPDGRVFAFEPGKWLPRIVGPYADRSLRRQVQRAVDQLGLSEPTLWVNDASYARLALDMGWPTVYDITDDWLQATAPRRIVRRLAGNEELLLAEADEVVVCSPGLAATRRPRRPDLAVIPNAVDTEHFRAARPRPNDLPRAPVAVYVGTLHEDRLDVELVARLARERPDVQVVLVGPDALTETSRARLRSWSNVHLLGSRPYADVPAYLQHADVIIIPHVVSAFTESLDPIKAYECVVVGRPTVATSVAGFRDLPGIDVADSDAFLARVSDALDAPSAREPGSAPSWSERACEFASVLERARTERSTRPLRVTFVNHCAQLSGGELALARLLPALEHIDAHVILGEPGPLEAALTRAGATVEVLRIDERVRSMRRGELRIGKADPSALLAAWRSVLALRDRFRTLDPDVVHTNSLKAAVYGGLAARLAGVPVVWHVRDRIASDYLPRGAVAAVRALARFVPEAIVFNSEATRTELNVRGPFHNIAKVVIHDSVTVGPAMPRARRHRAIRFAMVGRLAPWKGQDVFLSAFAKAFAGRPEQAVIAGSAMFGEDEYMRSLVELVRTLGIEAQVEFAGFVADVPALLADVDALVHASVIPEPFGQVVIEGMAAGLAVIATAAGGPAEVITDGVDGLLVPVDDVAALADAMLALATDTPRRIALGAAGYERSLDFGPDRTAFGLTTTWTRVAGRRRRARGKDARAIDA